MFFRRSSALKPYRHVRLVLELARLLGVCPSACGNPVERFLFSINERGDYVCGHGICSQCHSTLTPKLTEDPLECPFCRAPVRSFMVPILYEG